MELAILKARLQAVMSIDKNQKEIDAYQIRSIYFDNYDNSSYFENDAGVDDRKKLRVRVYNKSRKTIKLLRQKSWQTHDIHNIENSS